MKKNRSRINIIFHLISLLGKLAYVIIFAVFGGYIGNMCAIGVMTFGALGVAKLINSASVSLSIEIIIIITVVLGVLRGLLRYLEQYNNHFIAFKLLAALRDKIFSALRRLCPAKLESKQKGNIISMLTADVETLEVFYAHTISPLCIAILVCLSVIIFTSIYAHFLIGLTALVFYLIIGGVLPVISDKKLRKEGENYRQEFANFSSYYLDSIRGINEIVANHNEKERGQVVEEKSKKLNETTKRIKVKSTTFNTLSSCCVSLAIILSILISIICIKYFGISLSRVIVALVMIFSSFGPVLSLSALPQNLTQTFASGNRILDLLEEVPLTNDIEKENDIKFKTLEIKNLSFKYQEEDVLKNVNLTVNKGDIVGIEGKSGSGKSTILKLLLRFWPVSQNTIYYNDLPIEKINTSSLKENVVLVSQETYLFNDTILNNLKIANPNVTLEEIREACKKASIDLFIMSLDEQYDTKVGLLGDRLSAGEKQRIGLARAFLNGAEVILLDEPTSNVDAMNEGIILKSLKDFAHNKTIIMVSHRTSTMSICNKRYLIKEGVITSE